MDEERYIYPDSTGQQMQVQEQAQLPARRRKKKKPFSAACPIVLCLLAGAAVFGIWCLIDPPKKGGDDPQQTVPVIESQPDVSVQTDAEPTQTAQTQSSDTEPGETVQTEPVQTEAPTEPAPKELTFETVDESYFDDALFIGDSRTDGLRLYSPFDGATYYHKTSLSIYTVMDSEEVCDDCYGIRQLLQNRTYGKIYIMFGINEAYSDKETFVSKYESVIDEIRGYQPDAIIYIQSIMYVTAQKMANDPGFSNDGLRAKNEGLKAMANGKDIFYLEINEAINDGAGNLPSDYTNDGVHMKPQYYSLWSDYLLQHAIVLQEKDPGITETTPVETKPISEG